MQKNQLGLKGKHLNIKQKKYAVAVVLFPLIGVIVSIPIVLIIGINSIDICMFILMAVLSSIGIEIGYHRYLSHNSFKTNNILRMALAIMGCIAGEGPPIYWVATHRRHHQYSDKIGDPHSPNLTGTGFKNKLRGLWHAHLGWIVDLELTNTALYTKELLKDSSLYSINKYYFLWFLSGLITPGIIEGIITQSWRGFLSGILWGGIIRIFVAQNLTYSINSLCHVYGNVFLKTEDKSKNIGGILAILTWGSSYHNNHHAFPNTAINQFTWWQVDLSGLLLRILESIGLVWELKYPSVEMIAAKKIE
jgi:stearoyl-CoA desaturase (Delta-9 desaturase)